jgi:hypothetical protein
MFTRFFLSFFLTTFVSTSVFAQVSSGSGDLQFLSEAHGAEQSIPDVLFIVTIVITLLILLSAFGNIFFPGSRKAKGFFLGGRRYSVDHLYLPCSFRVNDGTASGYLRRLALDEADIMTQTKPEKGTVVVLDLAHVAGLHGENLPNPEGVVESMKAIGDSDWFTVTVRFPSDHKESISDVVDQLWPERPARNTLVY